MPPPLIGILGGMGPAAGVDMVSRITEETLSSTDQDHCPVLLYSPPGDIPDRTSYLLGHSSSDPAAPIADALVRMAGAGVTVAAIACNTAHADPILRSVMQRLGRDAPELRLLHMIEETVAALGDIVPGASTIGILGTQGTYRFRLYEDRLRKAGYDCVIPPRQVREHVVHDAIYDRSFGIKANPRSVTPKARENIISAVRTLRDQGADAVILGCTELPLAVRDAFVEGLPVIDPARMVARALIRDVLPERLRPWPVPSLSVRR
ncbi:MAG: aspartate/glutamate racemase family protein [Rhodothermales bacterium]|nr:aspartate/glutamate racemase family protein [Rhodothermales bacterium]